MKKLTVAGCFGQSVIAAAGSGPMTMVGSSHTLTRLLLLRPAAFLIQ